MQYLDGKTTVTHIIASNLTPKKVVEFKRYRIVKPAWIVDSIKAGKLLPWHSYRVVDEGVAQKVLGFDEGSVISQTSVKPRGYRDQTDNSWYTEQLGKSTSGEARQNTQLPTPGTSSPFEDDNPAKRLGVPDGQLDTDEQTTSRAQARRADEITSSVELQLAQDVEDVEDGDEDVGGVMLDQAQAVDDEQQPPPPSAQKPYAYTQSKQQTSGPQSGSLVLESEQTEVSKQTSEAQSARMEDLGGHVVDTETSLTKVDFFAGQKRKLESPAESPSKKSKLTAEEHNSVLLADPYIRKSSTLNPEFLDQYYRESRLHHLSTWKADLKAQLQAQTAELSSTQKAKQKRAPGARRYVLHVDFDSFFVAVSLKNCPEYINKPACVAHGAGPNSEIASCNYPAREFGVKNGMWMKHAHDKCKELKVLPYDFPAYESASRLFYEAIMATGGIIQSVSIDEALIDITAFCLPAGGTDGTSVREGSIWREQDKADEIARNLRDQVKQQTGCAVSVGIGTNILLAKVALRKAKPAGQYQIKPEDVLEFIGGLEAQDLPGVAHSLGGKLEELGAKYVRDIRELSREKLVSTLGPKTGEKMWNYARGIDRTEVGDQVVRKSVSAEVNWGVRFETNEQADEFVESLAGELHRRLLKERVKGKQLTMKVMKRAADAPLDPPKHLGHGKCDTFNKSVVLGVATNEKEVLVREVLSIFRGYGFSPGELRGLGVQMTRLEPLKIYAGETASSQRRLAFKTDLPGKESPRRLPPVPAFDDGANLQQSRPAQQPESDSEPPSSQRRLHFKTNQQAALSPDKDYDPIQDGPETPKKLKASHLLPRQGAAIPHVDSPGRKPLNTLGTQFIMPTQVDPQVLAELPADIRSKLAQHVRAAAQPQKAPAPVDTGAKPSNKIFSSTILPNQSQLDISMLDALPEDVRAEILEHYATSPSKPKGGQSLLPQSPHKNRTIAARGPVIPKSRGRGRPKGSTNLLSRFKAVKTADNSGFQQARFAANNRAQSHDHTTDSDAEHDGERDGAVKANGEIAPEFLEALPESIRQEVLAQHRAEQLKRTGGIEIAKKRGAAAPRPAPHGQGMEHIITGDDGSKERVLVLDPRPPRPTFTGQKLSGVAELREAMSMWYEEFQDEGPYEEDVEALGRYMRSVVLDEGDMSKAVDVIKWLDWLISQDATDDETALGIKAKRKWEGAVDTAKSFVREAVKARGLGQLDL